MKKIEFLRQIAIAYDRNAEVTYMSGNGYYFKPYGYIWADYLKDKKFVSIKFKTANKEAFEKMQKITNLFKNVSTWVNKRWNCNEYVIRIKLPVLWKA